MWVCRTKLWRNGEMLNKKEFERVSPESVGIPSAAVSSFLDALEGGHTQMHGLMIMRHGKICAEGWWQPYAPGKRHTCHSLTKTYMSAAIGAAITDGLLRLDDYVDDIFPEYKHISTLSGVTVRHLLCMGSGVERMPQASETWIRDFFLQEVRHKPGTAFFYNSAGSTMLGYIVRRVSGEDVYAYLNRRVFSKIGIDPEVSFPNEVAPKYDMWGHRMQATTEDNLRLMKLFYDGGMANGERILDEEYVNLAVSLQNESKTERLVNPDAEDNFCGYGFQMWMCQYPGAYRADGAGGQFSVVIPDKDMIVSITESASYAAGAQKTLECIWNVLLPAVCGEALPEDAEACAKLSRRLSTMAIPMPGYAPYSPIRDQINAIPYCLCEGRFDLGFSDGMCTETSGSSSGTITFSFADGAGRLDWCSNQTVVRLIFGLDGAWRGNSFSIPYCNSRECYAAGYWSGENRLELVMNWTEAVIEKHITFVFAGDRVHISGLTDYMPGNEHSGKRICATAVSCRIG